MALHVAALGEDVVESSSITGVDWCDPAQGQQHSFAKPAWGGGLEATRAVEPDVARVAGEQLVAPFPGENDGDRLASELANQVRWERRGIGDGLVHLPSELGEQ